MNGFGGNPVVVVTGFGPFSNMPVNASWEAVKDLNIENIEEKHNCQLVTAEVPVEYIAVDQIVSALWQTLNPKLMIHVGLNHDANNLVIETQASKSPYSMYDECNYYPSGMCCPANGPQNIKTKLDVDKICKDFNCDSSPMDNIMAERSENAGSYLCEYIFYNSLCYNNLRTLFVHVPPTDIYSSSKTAQGLAKILDLCLEQIDEKLIK